jgi:hypothetical protein
MCRVLSISLQNRKESQIKMKRWYAKDARIREFKPGEIYLLLWSVHGHPVQAK